MIWEAPSSRLREQHRYEDCKNTVEQGMGGDRDGLSEVKALSHRAHQGAAAAKITPLRSGRNRNTEDVIQKQQIFMHFTVAGIRRA